MLFSKRITFTPFPLIFIIICCIRSSHCGAQQSRLAAGAATSKPNQLVPIWKRPTTVPYPKVWDTFEERDLNNKTVKYEIKDFDLSKTDELFEHMRQNYLLDEPLCKLYGLATNEAAFGDMKLLWREVIKQKMVLVCYKVGSDEIIGANINFVVRDDDTFPGAYMDRIKSNITISIIGLGEFLKPFNPFKAYRVKEYLSSNALSVDKAYRGRSISEKILYARKKICQECGIKYTISTFSSRYAIKSADKVGFQTIDGFKFTDIAAKYPYYAILKNVDAEEYVMKVLKCL